MMFKSVLRLLHGMDVEMDVERNNGIQELWLCKENIFIPL